MTLQNPEFLNLGWLVAALAGWGLWGLLAIWRGRRRLGSARLRLTSRPAGYTRNLTRLSAAIAVLGCLAIALARPRQIVERRVPEMRKLNAVLLLDNSPSMRAQDIEPNRLVRATEVIADFIRKKVQEDRFALVSFTNNSLVLSYLTADAGNVLFYLEYMRDQPVLTYGTNIGGALKSGLQVLAKQEEIEPDLAKNKTVFILLSDGEDQGEDLQDALKNVSAAGIPVYAIGIGTRAGAPIPLGVENGKTVFLTGRQGEALVATFDESEMRGIAQRTGGLYYRAATAGELGSAFNDIFLKARDVQGFRKVKEPRELYTHFLIGAFGFFLLRVLL